MRPTDEQAAALDLFLIGESMVLDAGAGTGKTSTLIILASSVRGHGRYMAFNRAIVNDVADRLPARCEAATAHSMAFRLVGKRYARRLNGPRIRSHVMARQLGIDPFTVTYNGQRKRLAPGWLASHVMQAVRIYCQTADEEIGRKHFPYVDGIDMPAPEGKRTYDNNNMLSAHLEGALRKAWQDIRKLDGTLPFKHEHYLKLWQLEHPRISTDYVLFDEAQDANPVMAAVIAEQHHAQRVYVGDAQQAIYGFTGAIDAMKGFDSEHRRALTQSFRFGPAIAERANEVLDRLDADLRLRGLESIPSSVGALDEVYDADVVLCRTNAAAIKTVLHAQREGQPVHLLGGGSEIASFARAAARLMEGRPAEHYELSCFDSWFEVLEYVQHDPDGQELELMVRLIEEFTVPTILAAVGSAVPEGEGVLTVSTAHKAKGREWDTVRLAGDFADVDPSQEELRLLYVACTRAKLHLDDSVMDAGGEPEPIPELLDLLEK
jgi:superfamily I DNA/RNA helicase